MTNTPPPAADPAARRRLHERISRFFDARIAEAEAVARDLFDHPELSGEEFRSCELLANIAAREGFEVERAAGGLPTAFRAIRRGGGAGGEAGAPAEVAGGHRPAVAILAEYDALPDIGHGCGHNFIGTAGTFAALAVASVADELAGDVVLVGTPAEETAGGKIDLLRAGVFEGVDAAMMVHPSAETTARVRSLAMAPYIVRYHGKAAHAAASPWEGINALDAMIQLFVNIGLLKKQLTTDVRIMGVITDGGRRSNIIPERTEASFSVRCDARTRLDDVLRKFRACCEAAALATGCRVEIVESGNRYDDLRTSGPLADLFEDHFRALGGEVADGTQGMIGSLDIGNLSHHFPCIHPRVATCAPGVAMHTREFGAATITDRGLEQLRRSAEAMARATVDFLCDPELRGRVRAEFEAQAGGGAEGKSAR
jgi:amidohydrolase